MLTRRALLATSALLGAAPAGPRVAALDYGLTETLLALGIVPAALPDPADYRNWVIEPALPEGPLDLGQRTQPNLELLADLAPDLILAIQDHDPILPRLRRIAPTLRLPVYTPGRDVWARSAEAARAIGAATGRPEAAAQLIEGTERTLAAARATLAGRQVRPLLLGSFVDARHMLVYGSGSILDATLDRLGLRNAWTGPTGIWGSATVGLPDLAGFGDAMLFTIDPRPPDVDSVLQASPVWHALPFVRAGRVARLPPVLMFGTLPAAGRFVRLMLPYLTGGALLG